MKSKTYLTVFLLFFLGGLGWGYLPRGFLSPPPQPVSQQDPGQTKEQINTELGTFARLAQELKPSVVNISVVKRLPHQDLSRFSGTTLPEATGQGSGVIISADGDVLTNNHVVKDAKAISIKLADGREVDAEVVGTDENTDLALLRLEDARDLPVATLGDSDQLAVGEWVMAIGNPFGLEATVTVGVLSGKGRVIGAGPYDDFLQTDASINPGNSGGPLFNTQGQVIGINTAIVPGGQGIGFSIPINLAREVSSQLKERGRVVRGFIGVGIQPVTPALKTALNLPEDTSGALVASIVPGGPAAKAGLRVSDVVVAVNNNRISNDRELLREVALLALGKEVPVTVRRGSTEETLFVTIAERPEKPLAQAVWSKGEEKSGARVGVAVTDILVANETTVVVTQVLPSSPAARAGLKAGDFIRAVGSEPVFNTNQFIQEVAKAQNELAFLIERDGKTSFLVVKE